MEFKATHTFADVPADAWYYGPVTAMYSRGIITGYADERFGQLDTATRGQVVLMLYRLAGEPEVKASSLFRDVDPNMYYAKAIMWAKTANIVNGVTETEFAPEQNITRERLVTMLYRYFKYSKYDISTKDKDAINKFTDAHSISDFARTEMEWAVSKQVMKGSDVNTLMPLKDVSRSEICSLLYNYIGIYNID